MKQGQGQKRDVPIRVELQARRKRQPLGESPDLAVRITNVSDKPVWLVGVLPGSEGLRYPRYEVEIEGPLGTTVRPFPEGLDYARGLRPEDFVRLDPGESFDPQQGKGFVPIQQLAWFKPERPGKYRLRLRLDTSAQDAREWLGQTYVRDRQRLEELLRRVPKITVESEPVEIEFEPNR